MILLMGTIDIVLAVLLDNSISFWINNFSLPYSFQQGLGLRPLFFKNFQELKICEASISIFCDCFQIVKAHKRQRNFFLLKWWCSP